MDAQLGATDPLSGRHANQHLPTIVGAARGAEVLAANQTNHTNQTRSRLKPSETATGDWVLGDHAVFSNSSTLANITKNFYCLLSSK